MQRKVRYVTFTSTICIALSTCLTSSAPRLVPAERKPRLIYPLAQGLLEPIASPRRVPPSPSPPKIVLLSSFSRPPASLTSDTLPLRRPHINAASASCPTTPLAPARTLRLSLRLSHSYKRVNRHKRNCQVMAYWKRMTSLKNLKLKVSLSKRCAFFHGECSRRRNRRNVVDGRCAAFDG